MGEVAACGRLDLLVGGLALIELLDVCVEVLGYYWLGLGAAVLILLLVLALGEEKVVLLDADGVLFKELIRDYSAWIKCVHVVRVLQ